ncbi:MAG: phosphonate metabolism transcriptional regulator PhnF [Ancalomicrobiaceae bacterium]|nr:phosphonate metabolism transcriptional regulator PhnF [Ancalomicrobiaceae bacterium]
MDNELDGKQKAGPPLWRRVETALRQQILGGGFKPGAQLPSDRQIATAYGASRMTARRALAALEQEGLLRIEHGNGTFVSDDALVRYRLGGSRVRFGQDFIPANPSTSLFRKLVGATTRAADRELAGKLQIAEGEEVLVIVVAGYAGETPISLGRRHCALRRFAGLDKAFESEGSFTRALKAYGVEDYHRASTEVIARMPTPEEAKFLAQPRSQPVLAYAATDVETATAEVISYHLGCFAAERVVISIDGASD